MASAALRPRRDPADRASRPLGSAPSPSSTRAAWSKNPVMFVVEVVALLTTVLFVRDLAHGPRRPRLHRSRSRSGSGSRCCSPTSPRRWPRAAARRRPTRCARRATTPRPSGCCTPTTTSSRRSAPAEDLAAGRRGARRGRRHHPRRRRGHRGRRLGQRGGDHRRDRAGHPRVRRRPLGRDRRHARCSPTGSRSAITAAPRRRPSSTA